jgi:hypothetical protein
MVSGVVLDPLPEVYTVPPLYGEGDGIRTELVKLAALTRNQ